MTHPHLPFLTDLPNNLITMIRPWLLWDFFLLYEFQANFLSVAFASTLMPGRPVGFSEVWTTIKTVKIWTNYGLPTNVLTIHFFWTISAELSIMDHWSIKGTTAFAPKARRLRKHMLDDPSQMIDPINYCVLFILYGQIIPCGHMDNYDQMVSVIYLHLWWSCLYVRYKGIFEYHALSDWGN